MFPDAQVKAIDISEDALRTAKQNARNLNANVDFINHNILTNDFPDQEFDLIVSNPPYIGESEMNTISRNVIDYEPHLALFIKEPDPLIFYRAISIVAARSLKPGGQVLAEINERFGPEIKSIFQSSGLTDCTIIKDLSGKNRIVSAQKKI
jgi:release factor glutamine methyltransferase